MERIKIGTINVGGIYDKEDMGRLGEWLEERRYDVVVIVEIHLDVGREERFREMMGKWFYIHCNNRIERKEEDTGSGGVAMLIRKSEKIKGAPIFRSTKGMEELIWGEV